MLQILSVFPRSPIRHLGLLYERGSWKHYDFFLDCKWNWTLWIYSHSPKKLCLANRPPDFCWSLSATLAGRGVIKLWSGSMRLVKWHWDRVSEVSVIRTSPIGWILCPSVPRDPHAKSWPTHWRRSAVMFVLLVLLYMQLCPEWESLLHWAKISLNIHFL